MPDSSSILWPAEPHTLAKHRILEEYLKAWTIIMSRRSAKELLFVDGFAGPGEYKTGEPGSPLLATRLILDHSQEFPTPIRLVFVEKHRATYEHLRAVLDGVRLEADASPRIAGIVCRHGDCTRVVEELVGDLDRKGGLAGPAFFFLDQFGYSSVPLSLIARIMNHKMWEVFSYLSCKGLKRFMSDDQKHDSIDVAYGGQQWRQALSLSSDERLRFMLDRYKSALRQMANASLVWHFTMCDGSGTPVYWLFFCTNNLRGLEEMKRAMWKVDPSGGFRFSDKDSGQLRLFTEYSQQMLARDLLHSFEGRTVSVASVRELTLTETPEYRYKKALAQLEEESRLRVVNPPSGRRKGTFKNERMLLRFAAKPT